MDTFFLYARKSTEAEDRHVLSVESQRNALQALAQKMGITIAAVYSEAQSAKDPGRPIFHTLKGRHRVFSQRLANDLRDNPLNG